MHSWAVDDAWAWGEGAREDETKAVVLADRARESEEVPTARARCDWMIDVSFNMHARRRRLGSRLRHDRAVLSLSPSYAVSTP